MGIRFKNFIFNGLVGGIFYLIIFVKDIVKNLFNFELVS